MSDRRAESLPLDDVPEPGRTTSHDSSTDGRTEEESVVSSYVPDSTTVIPADGPATTQHFGRSTPVAVPPLPRIPGYTIRSQLGRGGMGVVYEAVDENLHRTVAIKMLTGAEFAGPDGLARFTTEARSMARVRHENVVAVYEVGEAGGRPYLVIEYAAAGTLRDQAAHEPRPPTEAASTVVRLARGLQACHEAGIVHRDLKPANVLLTAEGTLKIADFGLAKLVRGDEADGPTRTGEVMGTPAYMAPEQTVGSRDVGPACDVYALGAILYELLAGRPPFVGTDVLHVLQQVARNEPVSPRRLQPTVPRDLETICLKCLEKPPERRYASAADVAEDLERYLAGETIRARPAGPAERTWKWCRRRPTAAALIVISLVAVVALLTGSAIYNARLDAANAELSDELKRSREVIEDANELANWLLLDHVEAMARLKGNSPVQAGLLDRLRNYLDGLSQRIRKDETRLEQLNAADIGRAYERIAQIQGHPDHVNLGRTAESAESYRRAEAIWVRLVAESPNDVNRRYHLAGLRTNLADVLLQRGELDEAERLYEEQSVVCRTLVEEQPHDSRFGEFRVFLLVGLGDVAAARGAHEAALDHYEQGLAAAEVAEEYVEATPDAEGLVALCASRVGSTLEILGRLDEAASRYARVLEHHRALHERRPDDAVAQQEYAKSLRSLADLEFRREEFESSLASYGRAGALIDELVAADPENTALRRQRLISLERIGATAMMLERNELADSSLRAAVKLVDELAAADPENVELQRSRWIERDKLASLLLQLGSLEEAERWIREQRDVAAILVASHGLPADRQGVAQANMNLGVLAVGRLGAPDAELSETLALANVAIGHFEEGIAEFDTITEQGELTADQTALHGRLVEMRDTVARLRDSIAGK